jgi:hypothetical protein
MVKKIILLTVLIVILNFLPADSQTTNNALYLNNSNLTANNGFVYFGAPDYQFTDKITISLWVKWNVDPNTYANLNENYKWGNMITMDRQDYPNHDNGMFWFQHSSDNKKFEWAVKSVTGRNYIQSVTNAQKDKWYFLTGVYDGSADTTMKLYVNGVMEAFALRSTISGNVVSMNSNFRLNIGRIADSYRLFPGYLDEIRIWKRAVTSDEINRQMYSKNTINSLSLASYYDFEQTSGSVLIDNGPKGANGKFYKELIQVISTSGSPVTIVTDTTKNWTNNSLVNLNARIISGAGIDNNLVVSSNTNKSITFTTPFTVTPVIAGNNNMTLIGIESSSADSWQWVNSTAPVNISSLQDYSDVKGVWNANISNSSSILTVSNTNVGVNEYVLFGNDNNNLSFSGYDVPDSINGRISRVWKFNTNKTAGVTGKLTFNFAGLGILEPSKARILVSQTGVFASATSFAGTISGTTISINNFVFTDNITVTLGSKESTLPVELLSFTSSVNNGSVALYWKTSREINNKGFEIERSSAGKDLSWEYMGFIKGNGSTGEPSSYKFEDKSVNTGKYHYRIKQVDYNGVFTFYNLNNVVEINTPEKFRLAQNYPNPFNPATKIDFQIQAQLDVNLSVYDLSGKLVAVLLNKNLPAGYYKVDFNGSNLSSGTYFYTLKAGDFTSTKKMILVK